MGKQDDYRRAVRRAVLEGLLKEAESDEHKDLKQDLRDFAKGRGYFRRLTKLPNGTLPDALFLNDSKSIFVGDAKVAVNEGPGNTATLDRLLSYFREFAKLLDEQQVDGGILAVATNDEETARRWIATLNLIASIAGLTAKDGGEPDFQMHRHTDKTFVIYW